MALEDLSRTVTTAPVDPRSIEQTGVTLTIVFSDIESSTQWAEQLGDQRWFEVLAAHDDIVHRCVRAMGGLVVKQQGDGFMLTFPSARRATLFAQDVQRGIGALATTHTPIRVRIGLHVGEAINVHGDLFGKHVILAARIADAAQGGQILASSRRARDRRDPRRHRVRRGARRRAQGHRGHRHPPRGALVASVRASSAAGITT